MVIITNMERKDLVAQKLAELDVACRGAGLPVTSQRRVVMAVLAGRSDHPTAEEVYEAVQWQLPEVSRTTVYRVLDLLVRLAVASRIHSPSARARFDAEVRQHHHAICRVCEQVVDLRAPDFDDIPVPSGDAAGGFVLTGYVVSFSGICKVCEAGGAARSTHEGNTYH
jgi:Fur family peroxide stress response transcriptional regulator